MTVWDEPTSTPPPASSPPPKKRLEIDTSASSPPRAHLVSPGDPSLATAPSSRRLTTTGTPRTLMTGCHPGTTLLRRQERERRAIVHGGGLYVGDLEIHEGAVPVSEGGACPCGAGVCHWPNGTSYRGQWEAGRPHGIGLELQEAGEAYFGAWAKGMRLGFGRWVSKDRGCTYFGGWSDGLFHGQGTLQIDDGEHTSTFQRACSS